MSSLPPEFARLRLGYTPGPGEPSLQERERTAQARAPMAAAPGASNHFDWRDAKGDSFVSAIRDQGGCGSCVAFAACATVETAVRIARNDPGLDVDLSEAHLYYCIARSQGRTCAGPTGGWWPASALDGIENTGVTDESCYPYTAGDQDCANLCGSWQSRITKVTAWHPVYDVAGMKSWLATRGPLMACFSVYSDFYSYSTGVYHHVTGSFEGGHCVCVIGYDDTQGAWICKNSWGTWWGDEGFFLIRYGDCGIDSEMWAIDGVTGGPQLDGRLQVFVRGSDSALWSMHETVANGGWSGWESLGGALTNGATVARNADGRLEVFVRGTDNALYHRAQLAPNGGWGDWSGLGGALTSDPAVAPAADGRLNVFVRGTDNGVYWMAQTVDAYTWSDWAPLGGVAMSPVAVDRNADGRLDIFVRGSDNGLYHRTQIDADNWEDWSALGGVMTTVATTAVNADGRLQVFARGSDNALWTIHQDVPNGEWLDWESLGGTLSGAVAVGRNADGRLEVFVPGSDNALYHRWQLAPNGDWSDWSGLGGRLASDLAVGANADGRLQVFVRGSENALWTRYQTAVNGPWSGWQWLQGALTSAPSVARTGVT
jgi:hypothetical protein